MARIDMNYVGKVKLHAQNAFNFLIFYENKTETAKTLIRTHTHMRARVFDTELHRL